MMCKFFYFVFFKKFHFDSYPEMDPDPEPDPELSEKSDPEPDPDDTLVKMNATVRYMGPVECRGSYLNFLRLH